MEVITGLENDIEEVKLLMRSSSTAYASAAKALVRLRSGRDEYIALAEAVKRGEETIASSDARSSDLLSPLLLLLSHKDVPTTGVCASLSGIQRLAQAGMISSSDGENICNVLDQLLARKDNTIDTKLLQTCTVLAISPSKLLSLEVCGKLVILSSRIADEERTKSTNVRNTAIACLIQISTVVLERASKASWGDEILITASTLIEEFCSVPAKNEIANGTKAGFLRHVAFFTRPVTAEPAGVSAPSSSSSSTSRLGATRSESWIEPNKISNKDALEVLDSILMLVDKHSALRTSLSSLISDRVGPLVVSLLRGKFREQKSDSGYPFAFHVRLMRVTRSVMSFANMPKELVSSCLQEMLMVLESSSEIVLTPTWQYVVTLEALLSAFEHIRTCLFADLPLVKRTIDAMCKLMRIDPVEEEQEQVFWSSQYKSRGLELLSDLDPPVSICNPVLVTLISLECLVVILADGMLGEEMIRVGLLLKRPTASGAAAAVPAAAAPPVLGQVHRQVLEQSWRPCLTSLSSLLTACQEETAVQYLLRAYLSITTSCGRVGLVEARDAFISNMCEVALPSTLPAAGSAPVRLLNRKHLQVLKTLFNVAHGLGEMLGTSWHIVLETFEELDFVLHMQKQNLRGSVAALDEGAIEEEIDAETGMIDSMLNNLFSTSTFLSDDAVLHLVIALSSMIFTNVSTAITTFPSHQQHAAVPTPTKQSSSSLSPYAPRRLMETFTNTVKAAISLPPNSPAATTATRLAGEPNAPPSMLPTVDVHDLRFPPFCFEKMLETTELNLQRIGVIWDVVGTTLLTLASEADAEPRIRLFAVKSLEKLMTKIITSESITDRQLRLDVVKRFTHLIRSPQMDTREFALQALYRFVSSAGHRLEGLWNLLVAELLIVSLQPQKSTSALAFKVVQLIMDDYRPLLDMGCLPSLALCLRAFGEQQHDVNMALTSVHHLWLLCEKGDESLVFVDTIPTEESLSVANALWMHVFDQLRMLSLDPRMEVRNSALRSLCTNIVQCSDRLTVASWRNCSLSILLPLIGEIDSKAFSANSDTQLAGERLSIHSEQRMTVHHTQDTEEKQWRETRITALQGVAKLVCTIMTKLPQYRELEWFDSVWTQALAHVERTLGSNSPAKQVVTGAVSVLEELALLVCGAKFRTKYAVPGMKVENGALITTTDLSSPVVATPQQQHAWLWPSMLQVFARLGEISPPPFDANVATLLVGVMADLFEDKDISILRGTASLRTLLQCCSKWCTHFSTLNSKKNQFISPLERNVLRFLQNIPPIAWGNGPHGGEDVWNDAVLPNLEILDSVQQEEFHAKLHSTYLEFLAQAPNQVKSACLKSALEVDLEEQKFRVDEILYMGLDALEKEDVHVWHAVFARAKSDELVLQVILEKGLVLLANARVPLAIKSPLLELMREETICTTNFAVKVSMIRRFMQQAGNGGELGRDVFGPFLVCTTQFLISRPPETEEEENALVELLDELFALQINEPGPAYAAEWSPRLSAFSQPHLIHLLPTLEVLALQGANPVVREMTIRKLVWVAKQGWSV